MPSMPGFSAVIPTRNRKDLLPETLDSLLNQGRPFDRIVVVDDGSTDGTEEMMASRYPQCRYLWQTRGHMQRARNAGIAATTSDWVVFCDDDDLLCPGYLPRIESLIASEPQLELICCNHASFNADRVVVEDRFGMAPASFWDGMQVSGDAYLDTGPEFAASVILNPIIWPTGMAVKRSLFSRIGTFDERMAAIRGEDLEFYLRAIPTAWTALLRAPLARVRQHVGNGMDPVIQQLGELRVREFCLLHHPHASTGVLHETLAADTNRRRHACLYHAFQAGNWAAVQHVSTALRAGKLTVRERVKLGIATLPNPLRGGLRSMALQVVG